MNANELWVEKPDRRKPDADRQIVRLTTIKEREVAYVFVESPRAVVIGRTGLCDTMKFLQTYQPYNGQR